MLSSIIVISKREKFTKYYNYANPTLLQSMSENFWRQSSVGYHERTEATPHKDMMNTILASKLLDAQKKSTMESIMTIKEKRTSELNG